MPVDKKHFIELKFKRLSPSVRKSLKKLSLTELSELADQIDKVYTPPSLSDYKPISNLEELFGDLKDDHDDLGPPNMTFTAEEVAGWHQDD